LTVNRCTGGLVSLHPPWTELYFPRGNRASKRCPRTALAQQKQATYLAVKKSDLRLFFCGPAQRGCNSRAGHYTLPDSKRLRSWGQPFAFRRPERLPQKNGKPRSYQGADVKIKVFDTSS
jgi:hypothetical protein